MYFRFYMFTSLSEGKRKKVKYAHSAYLCLCGAVPGSHKAKYSC